MLTRSCWMMMWGLCVLLAGAMASHADDDAAPAGAQAVSGEHRFTIPNALNLRWPWDLTHKDYPGGTFRTRDLVVSFGDTTRPAQLQRVQVDGKPVDRVWFIATIDPRDDATRQVTLRQGKARSDLSVVEQEQFIVIDNGIYEFRLRRGFGELKQPRKLSEIGHWIGGMRVKGERAWDGRAWFEGDSLVEAIWMEKLEEGPLFVDFRVTITFAEGHSADKTRAIRLVPGKQSHAWKPHEIPMENVPAHDRIYEAVIRFVWNDPWIDVNERFHFPDGSRQQYRLHFGQPPAELRHESFAMGPGEFMPVDTVMWVRWFEYDRFGGNSNLHILPAVPRDAQRDRPFANLTPRWRQSGAGSQDFFLTRGGRPAAVTPRSGEVEDEGNADYSPKHPAVGIYATFASKWVAPGQHTMFGDVYDGHRGEVRFPMSNGKPGGMHYAQRAYAICVGPRDLFDSTGKANNLVRRHTDWTLVAQMNHYILEWERDPEKAGPHILTTRKRLKALQDDWKHERDTPAMRLVRESLKQMQLLRERQTELQEAIREVEGDARNELQAELRHIGRTLNSTDARILALITEGRSFPSNPPRPDLWIGRRYQDDFLNPTTMTRRMYGYAEPDLFSGGRPVGDAWHAAAGYIFSDLDHWPGWWHGWHPGNPNFHTDKYMVAVYAGAAMRDHPHADQWMAFALANFNEDVAKVLLPPDGIGWECPGYAGYSVNLQLRIAQMFYNTGYGNPIGENPLFYKTVLWHRKLITPFDVRIARRHAAPIGDTHRWESGLNAGFGFLAPFFRETDPRIASELAGTWEWLKQSGISDNTGLEDNLFRMDHAIPRMDVKDMDWSSQAFYGFGAIMRHRFGSPDETFLTLKAGPTRGHYHNDELAYHFYAHGTPISLDYNCSYTPRGDHAALHNSMTFGNLGTVLHNQRDEQVQATEEMFGVAHVGAFATEPAADAIIAERRSDRLVMKPIDPGDHEFARSYPGRRVEPITHRRLLALVKQPESSPLSDYLVVREETITDEPQQLNIHLLARDAKIDGNTVTLTGQLDKDMQVVLVDSTDAKIERRQWHYHAGGSVEADDVHLIRPGETVEAWTQRLEGLMREHNVKQLPLPDWQPLSNPSREQQAAWRDHVRATEGKAMIIPPHWRDTWTYGEYQVWLRIESQPGKPILWVLYPHDRGQAVPTIERIADGKGVRLTLGNHVEEVYIASDPDPQTPGQVVVRRDGGMQVILPRDAAPPIGHIENRPLSD